MRTPRIVIVGAGIGGLAAALDLSRAGLDVLVVEAQATPGGKIRQLDIGGRLIDAGPTVFTMKWVFDALFADAGTSTGQQLSLTQLDVLARHAWSQTEHLDLFADIDRSADAIGTFAGSAAARGYREFCARAATAFDMVDADFIRSDRPSMSGMMISSGLARPGDLMRVKPYATLWRTLAEDFRDPRLRQLFGRYATYSGSSPYLASSTLMLIAHVERLGVYLIDGGLHALARALEALATSNGARFRYGARVRSILTGKGAASGVELASGEVIEADAIIFNGDTNAIASGRLGRAAATAAPPTPRGERSQSAVTLVMAAETSGFALSHHNVFFSQDYAAEFDDVFRRCRIPASPTVYICAQDRGAAVPPSGRERMLCIMNAPADGDTTIYSPEDISSCQLRMFQQLARCGLSVTGHETAIAVSTPSDFEALFPATGGALYGRASHGWMSPFQRPTARSRIPRLYLCGGSTHPGAGVPMSTLSGRNAARSLLADLASTFRSVTGATPGGISTR